MKRFFKNKGAVTLIVTVILLGAIIGFINASGIKPKFVENIVNVIVTPIQKLITNAQGGVNHFFGYFSDVDAIKKENEKLKKENSELTGKLETVKIYENENETLRALLGLKESITEYETEAAQIVSRDPGNWFGTFTVDKGSANGVIVDQAVITNNKALVGRVYEVGSNWAKVITLIDPQFSAGALIERSGEYSVTEGDAQLEREGKLKLSYISKNTDIIVGDTLVTSGLGGIFPPGLLIGKVQTMKTDVQGISQYAVVEPLYDIGKIKNVLIIKSDDVLNE